MQYDYVIKSLVNSNFLLYFIHFAIKPSSPESSGIFSNLLAWYHSILSNVVLDKIREKRSSKMTNSAPNSVSSAPLLPQRTPQGPASVVKYRQKLQRACAEMKPWEKIGPGHTTVDLWFNCFRAYIRTNPMRSESGTRGYHRARKTRKSLWNRLLRRVGL